ncbi:1769_t:CDS:2, partial [Racocetra fulgida]
QDAYTKLAQIVISFLESRNINSKKIVNAEQNMNVNEQNVNDTNLSKIIEYDRFSDPEKIAEGKFGIISRYKFGDIPCVLKCAKKSKNCEVFDNE